MTKDGFLIVIREHDGFWFLEAGPHSFVARNKEAVLRRARSLQQ